MTHFLIEFRLRGYAKKYAKWARERARREARKLGVKRLREPRFVPHITLFGPAETHNLRNVIREVERVSRKYTLLPFQLGVKRGEFQNEDANWLYLNIEPSPVLEQLRYELSQSLLRLDDKIRYTCKPYDRGPKYKLHCSIGKYDPRDDTKFARLSDYAETKCSLEAFKKCQAPFFDRLFNVIKKHIFGTGEEKDLGINQHLLRITILGKGSRIQAEYDLVLKKMLSRREALSKYWWRKTIETFRELQNAPSKIEPRRISNQSVYLIGDTHFDHKNIIKYCRRPFSNVRKMNEVMINNWNSTVGDNETIYFLGDWTFGWRHKPANYWKRQLKGNIVSIRGSHDRGEKQIQFQDFEEIHIDGYDFLLIHNPNPNDKRQTQEQKQKLENWHGWIIHGHVHDKAPFIDGQKKRINVSVEVINYKPVSLKYLLSLGLDSIRRIRTIDSQPEKW